MPQSNWVWLYDCNILKATDKAILIEHDGEEYWLPLSQVAETHRLHEGDIGTTVGISEWIAQKKGIDGDD
jgi:chemotaxis protein histidine kinase CheA